MKNTAFKMTAVKITVLCATGLCMHMANAESFGFDRPGMGLGTAIVPKGHLAWEQSLPTLSYDEYRSGGIKQSTLTLQGDALARIGIGSDMELRLGWDGPVWQRHKAGNAKQEIDGTGDVQIGIKKAIQTKDDKLTWAVLAQANLANGDDEFTVDEEIYTLASAIAYQYSDDISTGITMSYDYQDGDLAWSAIPGLQYAITERLAGFSEYVYRKQESRHYESLMNTGLIWSVTDKLQFDTSVGYSFNRQNPRFNAGLGLSYLF